MLSVSAGRGEEGKEEEPDPASFCCVSITYHSVSLSYLILSPCIVLCGEGEAAACLFDMYCSMQWEIACACGEGDIYVPPPKESKQRKGCSLLCLSVSVLFLLWGRLCGRGKEGGRSLCPVPFLCI